MYELEKGEWIIESVMSIEASKLEKGTFLCESYFVNSYFTTSKTITELCKYITSKTNSIGFEGIKITFET